MALTENCWLEPDLPVSVFDWEPRSLSLQEQNTTEASRLLWLEQDTVFLSRSGS